MSTTNPQLAASLRTRSSTSANTRTGAGIVGAEPGVLAGSRDLAGGCLVAAFDRVSEWVRILRLLAIDYLGEMRVCILSWTLGAMVVTTWGLLVTACGFELVRSGTALTGLVGAKTRAAVPTPKPAHTHAVVDGVAGVSHSVIQELTSAIGPIVADPGAHTTTVCIFLATVGLLLVGRAAVWVATRGHDSNFDFDSVCTVGAMVLVMTLILGGIYVASHLLGAHIQAGATSMTSSVLSPG